MRPRVRLLVPAAIAAVALAHPAGAAARTFYGTVGSGPTISLTNGAGNKVSRIHAGMHTFVIRDRSASHNFVLRRGKTRLHATGVAFTGRRTWSVRIRAGARYVYLCRPHATSMRGTFRGVA